MPSANRRLPLDGGTMTHTHESAGAAARGVSRLTFRAVAEVARIVEGMHSNIAAAPSPLGEGTNGRTRGITGLVYGSIRGIHHVTGSGLDLALALLDRPPFSELRLPQPHWDAVLGVLNGVVGDHLAAQGNPLALPMQLRSEGRPIQPGQHASGGKLLLMVHGLCMNDRQWHRDGHDHGAALARELGYTPLYLFYNSGCHVSENGRALAALLEELVVGAATPVEELTIVGHSMGGLVARSACHIAAEEGHSWPDRLRRIVFLGTPHHGAPLERVGSWVQSRAELSPYVAPLARLGMLRSAGITDLRHGSLRDEDWRGRAADGDSRDVRRPLALPADVDCHAIAGTLATPEGGRHLGVLGDGLVPLESALGQHREPSLALAFPESHQWVGEGMSHFDLLSRPEVYDVIRSWLSG
jgi:pimeloyl-ACP methyl ester carboxylesterase